MLDKKTFAILQYLHQHAGSIYTVLEKQNIVENFPPKAKITTETVKSALAFLKENGYVEVKYQDKDEICLCCTIKAESYLDGQLNTPKTKISNKQFAWLFGGMFLFAFLGSLLAQFVFSLF